MAMTVQVRLAGDDEATLLDLVNDSGRSKSEIIRDALRSFGKGRAPAPKRVFIGMGEFDSGVTDLATNKRWMEDFGRKSLGKK